MQRSSRVLAAAALVAAMLLADCGGQATAPSPTPTSALGATYVLTDGRPGAGSGAVLQLSPDGRITTVARIPGTPTDVTTDGAGTIVVTVVPPAVMRITPGGNVSTLFSGAPLTVPVAVALDRSGNVIVGDNFADAIFCDEKARERIRTAARVVARGVVPTPQVGLSHRLPAL